jgi:hypothetical protein
MEFKASKYQQEIYDFVKNDKGNAIIEAFAGSGKCLKKGEEVIMYDGSFKKVEDIKHGELLMGIDSTPRKVLSLVNGIGKLYKISPIKGNDFIVNEDHILTFKHTSNIPIYKNKIIDVKVKDILNGHDKIKLNNLGRYDKQWKLFRVPIEFEYKTPKFDPYLIGLWLGDGTTKAPTIHNPDKEIIKYIEKFCIDENGDKKIPKEFIYNSKEVRLQLLAGLMDTYGTYCKRKNGAGIILKGYDMIQQLDYLIKSLGLYCSFNTKYVKLDGWEEKRPYYRLELSGHLDMIPTLVKRKQGRKRLINKDVCRTGWDISYDGEGEYYGFMLDGDKRFLTKDFIVTHNSSTLVECAKLIKEKNNLFVAFNKRIQLDLQDKLKNTNMKATTLHALGYSIIMSQIAFGNKVEVDNRKVGNILNELDIDREDFMNYINVIKNIKNMYIDYTKDSELDELFENMNITLGDTKKWYDNIRIIMNKNNSMIFKIDFEDMIYLPIINNIKKMPKDWVFIDECLPGATRILLSNGMEMPINEIVNNKLPIEIMTYNINTKKQEPKKVIGWSKTSMKNKKMLKIKFTRKLRLTHGFHTKHQLIYCTNNHKIFSNNEYIRADKLKIGDEVQFELAHGLKKLSYKNKYTIKSYFKTSSQIKCPTCDKIFSSALQLNSHKRIHYDYQGNNMSEKGSENLRKSTYKRNIKFKNNSIIRDEIGKNLSKRMLNGEIPCKFGGYVGNGYITKHQKLLFDELSKHDDRWKLEYAEKTGHNTIDKSGYPTNYKIDIAFPEHKLGIEVHGNTHKNKQQQLKDKKKIKFLESKGWKILEIWNEEIDVDINNCVDIVLQNLIGRSPETLYISSIEEIEYDNYVYDIEVEDNHNFYAEGLLVHNCQDISISQIKLLDLFIGNRTRVIFIGDKNQSIYVWRGASSTIMDDFKKKYNCKTFNLPITYRCPKSHLQLVKNHVPNIEAYEHNINGIIDIIDYEKIHLYIEDDGVFIARTNKYVTETVLKLLKNKRKATAFGKDIGKNIQTYIKQQKCKSLNDFISKLKYKLYNIYEHIEELTEEAKILDDYNKLSQCRIKIKQYNNEIDLIDTIILLSNECTTIQELDKLIEDIFSDDIKGIICSTVHKIKGLEFDNVYVMQNKLPMSWNNQSEEDKLQELNLHYVAHTRSKKKIVLIKKEDKK